MVSENIFPPLRCSLVVQPSTTHTDSSEQDEAGRETLLVDEDTNLVATKCDGKSGSIKK